jgi:hypothetical protein
VSGSRSAVIFGLPAAGRSESCTADAVTWFE